MSRFCLSVVAEHTKAGQWGSKQFLPGQLVGFVCWSWQFQLVLQTIVRVKPTQGSGGSSGKPFEVHTDVSFCLSRLCRACSWMSACVVSVWLSGLHVRRLRLCCGVAAFHTVVFESILLHSFVESPVTCTYHGRPTAALMRADSAERQWRAALVMPQAAAQPLLA